MKDKGLNVLLLELLSPPSLQKRDSLQIAGLPVKDAAPAITPQLLSVAKTADLASIPPQVEARQYSPFDVCFILMPDCAGQASDDILFTYIKGYRRNQVTIWNTVTA